MAITFVAAGVGRAGVGDITPDLPVGWAAGDLHLLVTETWGNDSAPAVPTGWTQIAAPASGTTTATDKTRCQMLYRFAQAGDTDPTIADVGNHQIGRMIGFRGVDSIASGANSVDSTNDTSLSIAGVTTDTDGCMVVYCATHGDGGGTWSSLAGHNLASITDIYLSSNFGNDGCLHLAYGLMTTAGATGTLTGTIAVSEEQAARCVWMRPAAGAAVSPKFHHHRHHNLAA